MRTLRTNGEDGEKRKIIIASPLLELFVKTDNRSRALPARLHRNDLEIALARNPGRGASQ
jgi:hypothetical protein